LRQENKKGSDNLLRCALLVAKLDNPDFQINYYLDRVDRLANRIAEKFPAGASSEEKLDLVLVELFQKLGYHGSTLDYYHRANSYINEVIDDREGLPITLCLLLMEIGKRLDLPIHGLATPGHFLALYHEPDQQTESSVLIDAFNGQIITKQQANELLSRPLNAEDFLPASNKEIISRILNNLLRSASSEKDGDASFRYLDALVAINPNDKYHLTLRAMNYHKAGFFEEALRDITLIIGSDRDDPKNAPLLEIERRLLDPHRPD